MQKQAKSEEATQNKPWSKEEQQALIDFLPELLKATEVAKVKFLIAYYDHFEFGLAEAAKQHGMDSRLAARYLSQYHKGGIKSLVGKYSLTKRQLEALKEAAENSTDFKFKNQVETLCLFFQQVSHQDNPALQSKVIKILSNLQKQQTPRKSKIRAAFFEVISWDNVLQAQRFYKEEVQSSSSFLNLLTDYLNALSVQEALEKYGIGQNEFYHALEELLLVLQSAPEAQRTKVLVGFALTRKEEEQDLQRSAGKRYRNAIDKMMQAYKNFVISTHAVQLLQAQGGAREVVLSEEEQAVLAKGQEEENQE